MTTAPLKTFIIYAREDGDALLELKKQLIPLERHGQIAVWYDGEIVAGQEWEKAIKVNLEAADIILLLLSSDFFASEYIEKKELKEALARHERGESTVVPVIVRHCIWEEHAQIQKLQVLPDNAAPALSKRHWDGPDEAFANVARGIARIVKSRPEPTPVTKSDQSAQSTKSTQLGLPDMVPVKGGTFQMGSTDGGSDEKPVHPVTLSNFEIGKYPVTQKLWRDIMDENPSHFKGDDCPVENVSWDDVQKFLKKLNARYPGKHYRLPTEAEWEYAARGGAQSKGFKFSGSNDLDEVAWYNGNSDSKTHPVGLKKANELGLHDMSGNVWEWCSDWYGSDYYKNSPPSNPTGPASGSRRVYRGGSWDSEPANCRVANRNRWHPALRFPDLGFRLARTQ